MKGWNNKIAYISPETEIIRIENYDVITTSSAYSGGNMDDGNSWDEN